jgi:serine/threonine protein kinase
MLEPHTLLQNRYLVVRLLGQGGTGAVYEAVDRKFGNPVALKEICSTHRQLRHAFAHEARLLNRLRHGGLPVVMDYFAGEGRQFLVMQFIPGQDLEQLLAARLARGQGPFAFPQVLDWADQLLDVLEYLHAQEPPVIHRDIKPQNLKLTPRGEVILLDFGLAKGMIAKLAQADRSLCGYTPHYAALEQIRGVGTDARSDLYSVAATLYHLLTGERPPDAMARAAAQLLGQSDARRPVNELNSRVPAVVAAVLARALSPHPDERPASAAIMRQTLRNAGRHIPPVSLHRDPTLRNGPLEVRRAAANADPLSSESALILRLPPQPEPRASSSAIEARPSVPSSVGRTTNVLAAEKASSAPQARLSAPPPRPVPPAPPAPPAQPEKKLFSLAPRSMAWLAGFAVSLFLLVSPIWLYRSGNAKPPASNNPNDPAVLVTATQTSFSGAALAIPMRVEALRYYLEIAPSGGKSARRTGLEPLAAGSKFKFHFQPRESGYLYIIALGAGRAWQTFLTAQPMPASGVQTNWVAAGRDFQFPAGGQWLILQRGAETIPFTIIFSPAPLETPTFLAAPAGRSLTAAEERTLAEWRRQLSAQAPEVTVIMGQPRPTVAVNVLAERPAGEPLLFDISLKRQ